jgi:ferredoxin
LWLKEHREAGRYRLRDLLHGYVYARWPYLYIGIAVGEHPLGKFATTMGTALGRLRRLAGKPSGNGNVHAEPVDPGMKRITFADTYHGKVIPLDHARQLVTVECDVRYPLPEQVIPYARARDIVLKNPDHIVVLNCPCRSSREHPCLPLDVCLIVGEPFASFLLEHHPGRSRRITPAEAVDILREEDERDLCAVDPSLCVGCGDCTTFCQFDALEVREGMNTVNRDLCMGCGVCTGKCAHGALTLVREPSKGMPLIIREIVESVRKSSDTRMAPAAS